MNIKKHEANVNFTPTPFILNFTPTPFIPILNFTPTPFIPTPFMSVMLSKNGYVIFNARTTGSTGAMGQRK